MSSPEAHFDGHIEIDRLKLALSYLKVPITADEIFLLAEIAKLSKIEVEEEQNIKSIHFHQFFRVLRRSIPELNLIFEEAKATGYGSSPKKQEGEINDLDSDCSDEIDENIVGA